MSEANKKFQDAVAEVLSLREQRRQIYGDGWEEIGPIGNAWHIVNKAGRLKFMLNNGQNSYESMRDTLLDIVNYSLFTLASLEKK